MNLGLLVTGGTLDSRATEAGLDAGGEGGVGDFLGTILRPGQRLHVHQAPWRIDSSQLETRMIPALAQALLQAPPMDAWIVVAGTDTLSWLAPALWLLLGTLPCPVLLVSGMKPWWDEASDGAANLHQALDLLASDAPQGVRIVSSGRLLVPYHLRKLSHRVDDPFRSLPVTALDGSTLQSMLTALQSPAPLPYLLPPAHRSTPDRRVPSVLWLSVHPGMDSAVLTTMLRNQPPRHIVLSGYSGGTLPLALLESLPPDSLLHLTSQQWGALDLEAYAASASLRNGKVRAWSLCPETVTSLLALADHLGHSPLEALTPLEVLQAGLFPARSTF